MKRNFALVLVVLCLPASDVLGQNNGGGNNNNGNAGGIRIDANGIVTPKFSEDLTGRLSLQRRMAVAQQFLPADINRTSKLRNVSLVRLEKEYRRLKEQGKAIPPEMLYLAGLQRIDYIFVYPDSKDIVISGPAEGFAPDDLGRVVGLKSRRPTLRLDDFIVALRTVVKEDVIGCSIDPVPERVLALKRYLQLNSGATDVARAQAKYKEMAGVLGMQKIVVFGVPDNSHFAQALVEADIRMKLIAIGLQDPGLRGFKSHLEFLKPNGNSLQRWWMIPLYDSLQQSEDGNAYQLVGQRVQMLSEDEEVNARGERIATANTRVSTTAYAKYFTSKFPQLAEAVPAFAELQNLFDLCIMASIVREKDLAKRVDWKMDIFLDEDFMELPKADVPKQIQSSYSYKTSQRMVLGQVSGGVTYRSRNTLNSVPVEQESSGKLKELLEKVGEKKQSGDREGHQAEPQKQTWWWD
ncbi:MAG: DUF1598 domain-containing protein [Planctomycetaceae bacterium]|nr:DUF1598 domain-containing protein [Planctomycetaceae bacterium]